jgi:hypothetical protein
LQTNVLEDLATEIAELASVRGRVRKMEHES